MPETALHLVGYGMSGTRRGCTGEAMELLESAERLIFRWDRDPIFAEIAASREVGSVTDFYDEMGSSLTAYEAMAKAAIEEIRAGRSLAFVTPGHPLICEAASLMLLSYAQREGIPARVVPGVSVIDVVPAALGRDPTEGMQVIAGTDLRRAEVQEAISTGLSLLVCNVNPEPRPGQSSSELETLVSFLRARYEPEHVVKVVTGDWGGGLEIAETTAHGLSDLGDLLEGPRVCYWIEGRIPAPAIPPDFA